MKQANRRNTERRAEGTEQDGDMPEYTTCMYLPASELYLIPFYDFYEIRD